MRVLTIKTSSLGDTIPALPVLDYLHQISPSIQVEWAGKEPFITIAQKMMVTPLPLWWQK